MDWKILTDRAQLDEINKLSNTKPVLIFKHSTRCGISSMALNRLERKWRETNIDPYFLDLLSNRDLSNEIAKVFGVMHQSPQAILVSGGEVVYHESHTGIDFDEINSIAKDLTTV